MDVALPAGQFFRRVTLMMLFITSVSVADIVGLIGAYLAVQLALVSAFHYHLRFYEKYRSRWRLWHCAYYPITKRCSKQWSRSTITHGLLPHLGSDAGGHQGLFDSSHARRAAQLHPPSGVMALKYGHPLLKYVHNPLLMVLAQAFHLAKTLLAVMCVPRF